MIIGAAEIITSALVFAAAKANDFIKNHEAHQQQRVQLQQEYCVPVTKLPADFPAERLKLYQDQCAPMMQELEAK